MNPCEPLLGAALAEHLRTHQGADRPTADNTLLRGSDAYNCARRIAFAALKIPRAIPYTTDTLMAFDAGQHHHARLQQILVEKFGADLEVPISYKDQGIDLSGHADAVYETDTGRRVVEIKSMKQFPFDKAIKGEGPKLEHVVQAGIYANAPQVKADAVLIAYINKQDGQVAEWLIDMDDEPVGPNQETLRQLVSAELDRLHNISEDIKAGLLPWRRIPGYGIVKQPPAANTRDDPWNCRYCPWQPLCARLPVSKVAAAAATQPPIELPADPFDAFNHNGAT